MFFEPRPDNQLIISQRPIDLVNFQDSLIVPPLVAILSVFLLAVHLVVLSRPFQWLTTRQTHPNEQDATEARSDSLWAELRMHIKLHGGSRIFSFKIARLLGSLSLLCLSMAILIMEDSDENSVGIMGKGRRHKKSRNTLSRKEWYQVNLMLTFLYSSFLALISVTAQPRWSKIIVRHLNVVIFSTFCVYFYRDIFPLMTFTLQPRDLSEGTLLWTKITILFLTAIVIPLAMPRVYTPVDPKNPMSDPSPELTSSIFSMAIHQYINSLVIKAYHTPHLPFKDLPPLSDRDAAAQLKAQSFKHLDVYAGAKDQHLFFRLMRIFWREYAVMSTMILLNAAFAFAGPIGINRLLHYIEVNGENAVIKPWVWVALLFLGPVLGCIAIQWYIFIATRTLVRADAVLTQLVFEHALRIRVKAETTDSQTRHSPPSSTSLTPDSISVNDSNSSGDDTLGPASTVDTVTSGQETIHPSTSTSKPGKAPSSDKKGESESTDSGKNLTGKINNLISTDLANITNGRDFLFILLWIPAQITLCIVFLYSVLGWSAFVGLAVILIMFPAPGIVAKLVQTVQTARMKRTDARVQSVTEAMNVLRMIKLFGWERKINDRIANKREEELLWVKYKQFLELLNGTLNFVIPVAVMGVTFAVFTVIMQQELSASKVFSSLSVFELLRDQLHMAFYSITESMTGKVSLDRLTAFLRETELLDSFSQQPDKQLLETQSSEQPDFIGFCNAVFAWSNDSDGTQTPSRRRFLLTIEDQLHFKNGVVNLVVGSTGSGKTSLLLALLGEMHFIPSGPDSSFNLPRHDGVAYAAQESWVLNETIRENILFGSEYDQTRYQSVVKACQLERDLELFGAGDSTEVGERGQSLSGGQRARITLARALYSSAKVLLLDDIFAALDVHTSKAIVDDCFRGPLVQGRTVILVTHNLALTRPFADYVIVMSDGRIRRKGAPSDVLEQDHAIAVEESREAEQLVKAEEEIETKQDVGKTDGKLIVAEEIETGHISWASLKLYLGGLGGNHPGLFFLAFLGGLVLTEILNVIQTWYLGYWASQYETYPAEDVNVSYYMGVYGFLLLAAVCLYSAAYIIYVFGALRASRAIHKKLVESVMGTTMRWLDTTPTARVITRATQDIRAVDGPIPSMLFFLLGMTLGMLTRFGAVVIITPIYLFPGTIITVVAGFIGQVYIKAQLSVKREMSNAKSPVLGHVGAAIAGLTSIRAYGAQQRFKQESLSRIDSYVRASRTFYNLNRWVCVRIESAGGLFAASLAAYMVYFQNKGSSTTGFSLNMAVGASGMILWWVRILNEFEVQGNSLERIQAYTEIEQEPKPTLDGLPPASWPLSGELVVENLSARYSPDGPKVLHNLCFKINSGERIGIVGRTGSGKSSLTLSILRCIYTDGTVYYDGLPTASVNLDALRAAITIIPQVPELLTGTLRQNLDPFDQHDDAVLNDALRSAGLFALQSEMDEDNMLHLDSSISSGGGNLSIGQRQILALARAIVRGSKLLILDEATSAIDYKTDSIIQSSLRNELGGDVTLITVAHRLQTIMDADRILVLDAGKIVEFDSPIVLLKKKQGRLRALVDQSDDRETLYAMAEGSRLTKSTTH